MKVLYLHGFASSPLSSKAQFFARRFEQAGVACSVPSLDAGDFLNLTITGQLQVIERAAADDSVVLVGSSLGGYLAALYAAQHPQAVERLVLLAPAFGFGSLYPRDLGAPVIEEWKRTGVRLIPHYGYGEMRELGYGFIEDARRYPDEPDCRQPVLILHGSRDTVVPPVLSERFAAGHANARLRILDSDHQLTDVTETLWDDTVAFLGL